MKAYEVTNPHVKPVPDWGRPMETEADLIAACAERGGVWDRYLMEELAIYHPACDQGRCPLCEGFSTETLEGRQEYFALILDQYDTTWQPELRF